MSFQDFAQQKGIHLLKDDIVFIKKCLVKIPYNAKRRALETYAEKWLSSMRNCDIVALRQNLGRRNANTWLREQVER